eukprot:TRINITY_DN350_c0_g1_i1.p1 TRINITY_DN350_c0_g1~~TRINITY_DN350_c0_g1_i1.p1  ORF type:complete len:705 (-),score=190.95 TRINITY_DN350_c0_g1_i1:91-2205(-)
MSNLITPVVLTVTFAVSFYAFGALISFFTLLLSIYLYFYSGIGKLRNTVCSVEIGEKKEGETRVRRSILRENALVTEPFPGVQTLYDVFQHGVKVAGDKPCFGTRPIGKDGEAGDYQWETYSQINKRAANVGSGLIELGAKPGDRIGFYSENRAEWMIASVGCDAFSLVGVSIYDTLGEESRIFIVSQSGISIVITKRAHLNNIFALKDQCPKLRAIIIYEEPTEEEKDKAKNAGVELYCYKAIEELGQSNPKAVIPPKPHDLAVIMYTSGTTSQPKGVLITHENLVSTVAGVLDPIPSVSSADVYLSYLPLAHILERACQAVMLVHGARIGFFQGNIRKLDSDIMALKPTLFAGVPKVYQRIMNNIQGKVAKAGLVTNIMFNLAYSIKKLFLNHGLPTGLLDKKIFAKVREGLGGRVRFMLAGGAPFGAESHEFLRICFGCPVMQGYGLTETCGGCSITPAEMPDPYSKAGPPIGCSEVKLVDAGKYKTSHNPPQGEICIAGPNVSTGYYMMEQKTAEDFRKDDQGRLWFHTGDVGQWNEDGTVSVIGRTKDIFKLDGGEYVSPERLEVIFAQSHFVANIFVYGESSKSFLVGVVVPEPTKAISWAEANGIAVPDKDSTKLPNCPESLANNEKLKKAIIADLKAVATSAKLNRFEEIVAIHVTPTAWTPDTGLVTDALKNKRPVLSEAFKSELAELYASATPI